jgi:hypothetical protein
MDISICLFAYYEPRHENLDHSDVDRCFYVPLVLAECCDVTAMEHRLVGQLDALTSEHITLRRIYRTM